MSRRQAAQEYRTDSAQDELCLLCGQRTPKFVDPDDAEGLASFDLCGRCNVSFRQLANALGQAEEARGRRAEVVDQVAGQLDLDDAAGDELGALELGAVLHGLTTGEWEDVPTTVLADVVLFHADGFRKDELKVIGAILRNRA